MMLLFVDLSQLLKEQHLQFLPWYWCCHYWYGHGNERNV